MTMTASRLMMTNHRRRRVDEVVLFGPIKKADPSDIARTRFSGWIDLAMQMAVTLALAVLAGVFGGRWLDGVLGTTPVFIIIGSMWGAVGGTVWVIVKIKQFSEAREREAEESSGKEKD